jgi:flagellar hook protein FlgE
MSYYTGLSGLAAATNDLNVIGNNIANANTNGFKQSTAQFADVYANSLASAADNEIGIGTQLEGVQQDFSQGTVTATGQALNVAIDGSGFFQMSNNGAITYSRDGVFQLNKDGYVTNTQGEYLMGYAANATGVVNSAATVPLQVPTTNVPPTATTSITAQLNLNAQSAVLSATPFSPTNAQSYNFSTSIQSYDSLGGTNQVNLYFVNSGGGTWNVYAGPSSGTVSQLGTVTFNQSGTLSSSTVTGTTTNPGTGQFGFTLPTTDGSSAEALTLNLTGTTQYGSANGVNNLTQDGYASGQLTNFSIGADGILSGNYSNGQTQSLGQIVLANFNDPNGLQSIGGNQYTATFASGVPQISAPGSTNHGTLTGGAIEESNVDLTTQLVDLITAQRNYQANAQTIKTQQTVDQTLINL